MGGYKLYNTRTKFQTQQLGDGRLTGDIDNNRFDKALGVPQIPVHLAPPGPREGDCLPFIPPGLKGFADARVLCAFYINTYLSVKISAVFQRPGCSGGGHSFVPAPVISLPRAAMKTTNGNHMDDDLVRSHQQIRAGLVIIRIRDLKYKLETRPQNFYRPS